uniref:Uncharacterized protein n=1 Tax=Romanomermis culicivorax TaxID=13658 RepID=A0A915JIF6_ROMCU
MLDGSQRETFLTDDILLPNGLVILHRRRELCWVDAGKQRLECTSTYGSGRRVVFAPLAHPFGLTVQNEETLYWTDWEE